MRPERQGDRTSMLRQTFAAIATLVVIAPAHAGDSIDVKGSGPAAPRSISYVGYDSFDASGTPICTPCAAKRAEEAARLKAYEERRERSREYMARLQGREDPAAPDTPKVADVAGTSPIAASAAELVSAGRPAPEKNLDSVTATPLRAGLQ